MDLQAGRPGGPRLLLQTHLRLQRLQRPCVGEASARCKSLQAWPCGAITKGTCSGTVQLLYCQCTTVCQPHLLDLACQAHAVLWCGLLWCGLLQGGSKHRRCMSSAWP